MSHADKPARGRPAENFVKPIKATPEIVARAIMQAPPKDCEGGSGWNYMKPKR